MDLLGEDIPEREELVELDRLEPLAVAAVDEAEAVLA
jgi:hypothetical protein